MRIYRTIKISREAIEDNLYPSEFPKETYMTKEDKLKKIYELSKCDFSPGLRKQLDIYVEKHFTISSAFFYMYKHPYLYYIEESRKINIILEFIDLTKCCDAQLDDIIEIFEKDEMINEIEELLSEVSSCDAEKILNSFVGTMHLPSEKITRSKYRKIYCDRFSVIKFKINLCSSQLYLYDIDRNNLEKLIYMLEKDKLDKNKEDRNKMKIDKIDEDGRQKIRTVEDILSIGRNCIMKEIVSFFMNQSFNKITYILDKHDIFNKIISTPDDCDLVGDLVGVILDKECLDDLDHDDLIKIHGIIRETAEVEEQMKYMREYIVTFLESSTYYKIEKLRGNHDEVRKVLLSPLENYAVNTDYIDNLDRSNLTTLYDIVSLYK